MADYELKALRYAERYGIVEYQVKKDVMTYLEKLPTEGIYKATVDLNTMKESRKKCKGE